MELVRAAPLALLATLALTAARHAPPAPPPATVAAPATSTIKSGVEKWRAGDYAAAVAIWTPFAAAGDPDALFNMGQAYKLGRGVTADASTARDYYRKAAVKGHLPAQANLGIALFQAGEKPEAIKWLRTAADRGEARAQYVLGIAAFNGDGIPRSQSLGYGYLLRAQASGLPQAVTALGTIAPGLSPADRAAGETVAASLAAGTGVPAALAATSPRLIPAMPYPRSSVTGLPVVTPPSATPSAIGGATGAAAGSTMPMRTATAPMTPAATMAAKPAAVSPPVAAPPPAAPALAAATPLSAASSTTRAVATPADSSALPPAPRPTPPLPIRQPTPAQADVNAAAPRPAVAAIDIPPSHPAALPAKGADPLAPPARLAPAEIAHAKWPPERAVTPLKPFETATEPAKKPEGWRVQLGAFSARRLADAAWNDVKATAAPAKPIFATDGSVTKLQMGPFATRDAAKAACTKLTAAGRACFVTPA